ncbi:MAG: MFS transporter [Thiomonas sp. 20-64-5]|nr:MAG: MFS transporter [Thiomonas sp. 20-64-5]
MSKVKAGAGWAVFRIRDYALYFASRFLSGLAFQMNDVAVGWLVYERTGSALALGLVGLSGFMPSILLALVVGQVADRVDRRIILIVSYGLVALTSSLLILVARHPAEGVLPIYGLVLLMGVARAFSNPASQAIVPTLVPRELFASAVAINSSSWQTATIIGPAVGGFAYALGAPFVFTLTTCLFVATVAALVLMHARVRPPPSRTDWATLTAGFRFIAGRPLIFGSISLDLFAVLLGGATALLPIYARDILQTGPMGLGLLRAMPALGAFTTSMILAQVPFNQRVGRRMFTAVALFGIATIVFGLSRSFWITVPALVILGASDMVSVYVRQTLVQIETPDAMRGRVSAVNTLFIGASNQLGEFESGAVASLIGPVGSVVVGGLGTLVVVGLWMWFFPVLRERDRLV